MALDDYILCTWSLSSKVAMNITLLVGLTVHTISKIHEKELRVNRLSLLPLYCVIGIALFNTVYYLCIIFFVRKIAELANVEDEDQTLNVARYSAWRAILGAPRNFFFGSTLILIACYSHLLQLLLKY